MIRIRGAAYAVTIVFTTLTGVLSAASAASAPERTPFGAFGPEGPRFREQFWLLPSADPSVGLRATVFRPSDNGAVNAPRPMVVINHGTSDLTRESVSMPVYYWLSRWFVERGYVVVLPQRRGHGATGGPLVESIGNCADPDHFRSGLAAAADIAAAIGFMNQQSFIDPHNTVVVGISTGGWASLALTSFRPAPASVVINFAGGRGGHAAGRKNAICSANRLIEASRRYASASRTPTLWLYSENDSYFGPDLASSMAAACSTRPAAPGRCATPPQTSRAPAHTSSPPTWPRWPAPAPESDPPTARPPPAQSAPNAQYCDTAPRAESSPLDSHPPPLSASRHLQRSSASEKRIHAHTHSLLTTITYPVSRSIELFSSACEPPRSL